VKKEMDGGGVNKKTKVGNDEEGRVNQESKAIKKHLTKSDKKMEAKKNTTK